MWFLQVVLVALICRVYGRPEGAPFEACKSLHPGHSGQLQQYTPLPYDLLVDKPEPRINDVITLTIKGKEPEDKIAGFLVQAREKAENPIGTFATSDFVKTIDCPGGTQNTATHTNPNPKDEVVLTWTPPKDYDGHATFFVTVAKSKDVFWVARTTETLWFSDVTIAPSEAESEDEK